MHDFKCFINKTEKKILSNSAVEIEPLYHDLIVPVNLITTEIKTGDIFIIEFNENIPIRIFTVSNNNLLQIFGSPVINPTTFNLNCIGYNVNIKIEELIFSIYNKFTLNEILEYKEEFQEFESHFYKHLLVNKKLDHKKTKQIIFKTFKNEIIVKKIITIINKTNYIQPEVLLTKTTVNLLELTVQFDYES